jgi:hypothetical protein
MCSIASRRQLRQPTCERRLNLCAARRSVEPGFHTFALYDDECRQRPDPEATSDRRLLVNVDAMEIESIVIRAPLEHLSEVTLGPARGARAYAVKEHQLRPRAALR